MKYINPDELRVIVDLIDFLNEKSVEVGVNAALTDINGEVLGYVRIADSTQYALFDEPEATDD